MSVLISKANVEKIKILVSAKLETAPEKELLVSDMIMYLKELGWKGLTSKDMSIETEKSVRHCWGGFSAVLEKIGFKVRYEKHGAGLKSIVSI